MDLDYYVNLYHDMCGEQEIDNLRRMAIYFLTLACMLDEEVAEEESDAFMEYAAINMGTLKRTLH